MEISIAAITQNLLNKLIPLPKDTLSR